LGAGSFKFASRVTPAGVGDVFALTGVARFDATRPDAARFDGVAGAISMPNIFERSSLASTFALAGRLRFFERTDPAFAIKPADLRSGA
jgi:hypothetical protein